MKVDVLLYFTLRMTKGENQFVEFSKYLSRAAHADGLVFYNKVNFSDTKYQRNPSISSQFKR